MSPAAIETSIQSTTLKKSPENDFVFKKSKSSDNSALKSEFEIEYKTEPKMTNSKLINSLPIKFSLFVNKNSNTLGKTVIDRDFSWSTTDEPHATRRKIILSKYPQIAKLVGPEPLTCPLVLLIVSIQICCAYFFSKQNWWVLMAGAYVIGGTLNHSLQLVVHELSHNLAFYTPSYNRILGCIANLPTCLPTCVTFQKYHLDHHQFQGVDGIDTDVPTMFEVNFFTNSLLKFIWVILQPIFYGLRPVLVKPKPFSKWELLNWISALTFDFFIYQFIGFKAIAYLIAGTILGLGFHPSAGHFIAEHYEFIKGQETYSYYGFWNLFNFNVGYHNEHHDFPKVPWSRLPMITQIAPEYYTDLPHYTSYLYVFYKYIFDADVGPASRVKRQSNSQLDRLKKLQQNAEESSTNPNSFDESFFGIKAEGMSSGDAQKDSEMEKNVGYTFRVVSVFALITSISAVIYGLLIQAN